MLESESSEACAIVYMIRPAASLEELAEAFDVIGAQLPQRLTHEGRRFADLVARLPEDRSLMLVVEDRGRLVGGALAFRRSPPGVTLRVIGHAPDFRATGLGRRLVEQVEAEAAGFNKHLGYAEAGGAWDKQLEREPDSSPDIVHAGGTPTAPTLE